MSHRRTDPACAHFRGYGRGPLGRWLFERGRGKSCRACMLAVPREQCPDIDPDEGRCVWSEGHAGDHWHSMSGIHIR